MDVLTSLKEFSNQISDAVLLANNIAIKDDVKNILVSGMGGSAIAGDILRDYLKDELRVPMFVNRDYLIPRFVDKETLVFIISYSGKTEETLSAYEKAKAREAQIITITSGNICDADVKIPKNMLPRCSLAYLFFPILKILENSGVIGNKENEIRETINLLKNFDSDEPKNLAKELEGKMPIFYGPERYSGVLYRWKTQLNENSKILAHVGTIPEINHNEIEIDFKNYCNSIAVVFLIDEMEDKRILKQIKATEDIISEHVQTHIVNVKGNSLLSRIFYAIHFGDWLSYYLAELKGIKPEDTPNIKRVKESLKSYHNKPTPKL
jgi:glucose/mannose-6-phosphate isomerase